MLSAGAKLPDFKLQNQDGKSVTNADLNGQWTVLYIYPKDDTPGCTIQGKSFTASRADFDAIETKVLGLSEDDVASHKNFCNKFSFTIDLLADPDKKLLSALGVAQSDYKGSKYWDRTTFVIDDKGMIRKVYEKVTPQGHEQTLLTDIRALRSAKA